jgi:two-component system response regulator AtoC
MTNTTPAVAFHAYAPPLSADVATRDLGGSGDESRCDMRVPDRFAAGGCCAQPGLAMHAIMSVLARVADSDVGVLFRGESGVGKEVIARDLHRRSRRHAAPFVKVNCAALPANLLESELFGHERGAFTGAWATRLGKFEYAQHGTIMLDEIGEMAPELQAKLLHVLQDGVVTRLGSNRPIDVDVRVLAATNCDLEAMIQARTFREDLYYRLQVMEIRVPPLRERREEIPALTSFFLAKYAAAHRRPSVKPSAELAGALAAHLWPGNIRELENMMQRCVVLQDEPLILAELRRLRETRTGGVPALVVARAPEALDAEESEPLPEDCDDSVDLRDVSRRAALHAERLAIADALSRFRWNRRKASVYLNVSYKTLLNKIKECGIKLSDSRG